MQLWPVGYEVERAAHKDCILRSSIADGGNGVPLFTVALVPTEAGQEPAVRDVFHKMRLAIWAEISWTRISVLC